MSGHRWFFFFNWSIVVWHCCIVSAVQRSESATCTHIFPDSWTSLHPWVRWPLGYHRASGWAPCDIQQVPPSFPFSTWSYGYVDPHLPIHPTLPILRCALLSVSHLHICASVPALQTGLSTPVFFFFFRLHIYAMCFFFFLFLIYFILYDSL